MQGFKVFKSIIPRPDRKTEVSAWDHPIQSFVWDDFTGEPGKQYEYPIPYVELPRRSIEAPQWDNESSQLSIDARSNEVGIDLGRGLQWMRRAGPP